MLVANIKIQKPLKHQRRLGLAVNEGEIYRNDPKFSDMSGQTVQTQIRLLLEELYGSLHINKTTMKKEKNCQN